MFTISFGTIGIILAARLTVVAIATLETFHKSEPT
jgi:predicted PurR-regulated permease PerM